MMQSARSDFASILCSSVVLMSAALALAPIFAWAGPVGVFPAFSMTKESTSFTAELGSFTKGPSIQDRLSYSLGIVSIGCWLIPGVAQLWQNYKAKTGDGISLAFLSLWLAGDVLNGVGAELQGLLLTQILLALYYVLSDLILIGQVFYYNHLQQGKLQQPGTAGAIEHAVSDQPHYGTLSDTSLPEAYGTSQSGHTKKSAVARYGFAAVALTLVGIVSYRLTPDVSDASRVLSSGGGKINWPAQLCGWTSASLYAISPIPQMIKNRETKCIGLSLALFIFAAFGNLTQTLSIIIYSPTDKDYLIANSSWIIASGLPIIFDVIIIFQFVYYAPDRQALEAAEVQSRHPRRQSTTLNGSGFSRRFSYSQE